MLRVGIAEAKPIRSMFFGKSLGRKKIALQRLHRESLEGVWSHFGRINHIDAPKTANTANGQKYVITSSVLYVMPQALS